MRARESLPTSLLAVLGTVFKLSSMGLVPGLLDREIADLLALGQDLLPRVGALDLSGEGIVPLHDKLGELLRGGGCVDLLEHPFANVLGGSATPWNLGLEAGITVVL